MFYKPVIPLSMKELVCGVASFITTDEKLQYNRGGYFYMQAKLPEGFPFHQFFYLFCLGQANVYIN